MLIKKPKNSQKKAECSSFYASSFFEPFFQIFSYTFVSFLWVQKYFNNDFNFNYIVIEPGDYLLLFGNIQYYKHWTSDNKTNNMDNTNLIKLYEWKSQTSLKLISTHIIYVSHALQARMWSMFVQIKLLLII